jgi:hypothetical protein
LVYSICLGTGSGAMGKHTKNGGYLVDWNKVRTFVVPDLENFTVRSDHFFTRVNSNFYYFI